MRRVQRLVIQLQVLLLVQLSSHIHRATSSGGSGAASSVPTFDRARPDALPAPKTNAVMALETHGKGQHGTRAGARQYWSSSHCEPPSAYRPQGGTAQPCDKEDLSMRGGSASSGEHTFESGLRICKNHAIRGQLARCEHCAVMSQQQPSQAAAAAAGGGLHRL
jgi:hypothetical protein